MQEIVLPGKVGEVVKLENGDCYEFEEFTMDPTTGDTVVDTFNNCEECYSSSAEESSKSLGLSSTVPEEISSAESVSEKVSSAVPEEVSSAVPEEVSSAVPEEVSSAVAPGPAQNLCVTGAGHGPVNGTYTYQGGETWANDVGTMTLYKTGSAWVFDEGAMTIYYENNDATSTPPLTGWIVGFGLGPEPPPTIAVGVCPSEASSAVPETSSPVPELSSTVPEEISSAIPEEISSAIPEEISSAAGNLPATNTCNTCSPPLYDEYKVSLIGLTGTLAVANGIQVVPQVGSEPSNCVWRKVVGAVSIELELYLEPTLNNLYWQVRVYESPSSPLVYAYFTSPVLGGICDPPQSETYSFDIGSTGQDSATASVAL